jgi:hypothetical protein
MLLPALAPKIPVKLITYAFLNCKNKEHKLFNPLYLRFN